MATRRSLDQFVADENVLRKCWVCSIPECDEVTLSMKTTPLLGAVGIGKWLVKDCGYKPEEINIKALEAHKRNQHGVK